MNYYDYVITKPDLNEETLAHYGILLHSAKGGSWSKKDHKYITRKMVNGKWVYTYAVPKNRKHKKSDYAVASTKESSDTYKLFSQANMGKEKKKKKRQRISQVTNY